MYRNIGFSLLAYLHYQFRMVIFYKSLLSHIQKSLLVWILSLLWPSYNSFLFLLPNLASVDNKDYWLSAENCYHDLTLPSGTHPFSPFHLLRKWIIEWECDQQSFLIQSIKYKLKGISLTFRRKKAHFSTISELKQFHNWSSDPYRHLDASLFFICLLSSTEHFKWAVKNY